MQTESIQFGQALERPPGASLAASLRASVARAPLFHAAWLFALGIVVHRTLWLRPSFVLIAVGLTVVLCCIAAIHATRLTWLTLALLWTLLGLWCAQMEPQPAASPELAALADGLLRSVEGTVIDSGPIHAEAEEQDPDRPSAEEASTPSQRIDLNLYAIESVTDAADAEIPVSGVIRLTIRWPLAENADRNHPPNAQFHCGDRIRTTARLLEPETYHDPGVWSREDTLIDQGVTAAASVPIDQVEVIGHAPRVSLTCLFSQARHASSIRILALPGTMRRLPAPLRLSADDAAMLAAMITGDRTYLTRTLRAGFERTGSFHMLVVSGFHLAIVAGCIFWVARRLRLPAIPATLATLAASCAYALFTGFATPVQRSLWMVTLYLLARLLYRQRSPLNTIGFAALCLLAVSPRSLFESSLQMTLLALIAIAGIAAPLLKTTTHPYVSATRNLSRTVTDSSLPPRQAQFRETLRIFVAACESSPLERVAARAIPFVVRFVLRLIEVLTVSCIIELAMTLPMALYFHRITVFALPVNLFILPLLLVLVPAALIALLISLVSPAAAAIPAIFVALPLHFGAWLVHRFSSLRFGDIRIQTPTLAQSIAFCTLFAVAMLLAHAGGRLRRLAWAALTLAALAAIVPRTIEHPHNALLVEAIDVGQGDSLLLITPEGKTLLVDGGGFGGNPRQAKQFDIGEEVVSVALWARGIRHLDAVALTHAHADHMGGLPAVLRNFHPSELWIGSNPNVPAYDDLLSEAAELRVNTRSFRGGDAFKFGSAQVAVLAPMRDYRPGTEPTNDDSLVLHIAYGATSVLLEGDAEAAIEQAMLSEPGLASTLLKVGHHGSLTSTRPEFLTRVAPRWAVISCGLHNRYGHPREEVLAALEAADARTFSTDINGAACFTLNGTSVEPDPYCGWQHRP